MPEWDCLSDYDYDYDYDNDNDDDDDDDNDNDNDNDCLRCSTCFVSFLILNNLKFRSRSFADPCPVEDDG